MMRRRQFITLLGGAAAALPLAARAQQPVIPVIGLLLVGSAARQGYRIAAIKRGLSATGFVEGQNVAFEHRWAEDHNERLPQLAADLVAQRVAVLIAVGNGASFAAKAATASIPVVFETGIDPVSHGLVANLARPEGNVTGVTFLGSVLIAKHFELLHETVPGAKAIGLLENATNPNAATVRKEAQAAADALGQKLIVASASVESELEAAVATLARQRVEALLIRSDTLLNDRAGLLADLVTRHALPTIHPMRDFALAGGLMSYGASLTDALREVGVYAGRVLKGERIADLPIQQSAKVEFVINLKAAKALGVTFPLWLLGRADEVIE